MRLYTSYADLGHYRDGWCWDAPDHGRQPVELQRWTVTWGGVRNVLYARPVAGPSVPVGTMSGMYSRVLSSHLAEGAPPLAPASAS
jgi:hypothetical protein